VPEASSPPSPKQLRPWYLVLVLVLTWFVGFQALAVGCRAIDVLRGGALPDVAAIVSEVPSAPNIEPVFRAHEAARLVAMADEVKRAFPREVARFMLGRGAPSLFRPALAASSLFVVVDYLSSSHVRLESVRVGLEAAALLPEQNPMREVLVSPDWWWTMLRMRLLAFDLFVFGLAFLAVSSARAQRFFDRSAKQRDASEDA
jgi:hypothetical protein